MTDSNHKPESRDAERGTARHTNRLAVDIGGTFTDVVIESCSQRYSCKVLTTHAAPDDGVMQGIAQVLEDSGKSPSDVRILLHGTTLATNALIERKGALTGFLTTAGFRDILAMGFEKRFAQYNLDAKRPTPLVPRTRRYVAAERIAASGKVIVPLDTNAVRQAAAQMRDDGVEAVAIGFLQAYAHPQHEQQAAEILAGELPGVSVCLSSEVCPEMREYERFSTTVANAYVRPLMAGYLGRLKLRLEEQGFTCATFLMQSGGGLTTLSQAIRLPIRLVESGPAGGAILAADIAKERGIDAVLAFDMGGTTAKIALIENGTPARSRRFEIAREYRDMKGSGLPVRIPVIEMVEIGAGGGSIASIDELQRIRVGPHSAGSDPGPVAYALGGTEATVTDANLALGKLDPFEFAGGTMQLDVKAAAKVVQRDIGDRLQLTAHWPAAGIVEIVEENMANAARVHAVERGKEPSEYTMIAFGGGAPLHAARLAGKLGIQKVVVPVGAGVGSAIGFLRAPVAYQVVRSYRSLLGSTDLVALNTLLDAMADEATQVVREGVQGGSLETERIVDLRYLGQGHELAVTLPSGALSFDDLAGLRTAFEHLYNSVYGLTMPEAEVECVSWSVTLTAPTITTVKIGSPAAEKELASDKIRSVYDAKTAGMLDHHLHDRYTLVPGDRINGPAVVKEQETSTVVPSDFSLEVDAGGALVLTQLTRQGATP